MVCGRTGHLDQDGTDKGDNHRRHRPECHLGAGWQGAHVSAHPPEHPPIALRHSRLIKMNLYPNFPCVYPQIDIFSSKWLEDG